MQHAMLRKLWLAALPLALCAACTGQEPPVAEAGPDQTGVVGQPVQLDGRASRASGRGDLEFRWWFAVRPTGSGAELQLPTTAQAWFTPDVAGQYQLRLQVREGEVRSEPAALKVEVRCSAALALEASAGSGQGPTGQAVVLRATARDRSVEAGCAGPAALADLRWRWQLRERPAGSLAQLADPGLASPQFTPDRTGRYLFRVEAWLATAPLVRAAAEVAFVATCGDAAPAIVEISREPAGALRVGEQVLLRAQTDDPDRDTVCGLVEALSHAWQIVELPAGSQTALLGSGREALVALRPDRAGVYGVELTVTDPAGHAATSRISFTVGECGTHPPRISELVAEPAEVPAGHPVRLSGLVTSGDPDGCPATEPYLYSWRFLELPAGSGAWIHPVHGREPSVIPDVAGDYQVELAVTDALGHRVAATVPFSATACGQGLPQAEVTVQPAAPRTGQRIRLQAAVEDPDLLPPCSREERFTYHWSFLERPPRFVPEPFPAQPEVSFVATVAGFYLIRLEVRDAEGQAGPPQEARIVVAECGDSAPHVEEIQFAPAWPLVGTPVSLAASITDPDEEVGCELEQDFSLRWRITGLPAGSEATLHQPEALRPWLVPDRPGRYLFELQVVDAEGHSTTTAAALDVGACGFTPPVVAGLQADPAAPAVGSLVRLTAILADADTSEECGLVESFRLAWRLLEAPAGFPAAQAHLGLREPWFQATLPGMYRFELVVEDHAGLASVPAELAVQVGLCGSAAPVIDRIDQTPERPEQGAAVQLSVIAHDPDTAEGCGSPQELSHDWQLLTRPAGSVAQLVGLLGPAPSFVADRAGSYRFRILVTDPQGHASAALEHEVEVGGCGSAPPVVDSLVAQPAQPAVGQSVRFTALVRDADQEPPCGHAETFTHHWQLREAPLGSQAQLSGATRLAPTLVPDQPGRYTVGLTVSDALGLSSVLAALSIDVAECGSHPPLVERFVLEPIPPAVGQEAHLGVEVTDLDIACGLEQEFRYFWQFTSLPAGSQARLRDPQATVARFTPDRPGRYGLRVVVLDQHDLASPPAEYPVEVSACGSAAPEVFVRLAPENPPPRIGVPVGLEAVVHDPDEDAPCLASPDHDFSWSWLALPAGSQATLLGATGRTPSFVPDRAGEYVLAVQVSDPAGIPSRPAQLVVVVPGECGAGVPSITQASADPAQNVVVGALVSLRAAFTDPDAQPPCNLSEPLQPTWRFVERPAGSQAMLNQPYAANPSFVADGAGRYVLEVLVQDGAGHVSGPRSVAVEVVACGDQPPLVRVQRKLPLPVQELVSATATRAIACMGAPFIQLDASGSTDPDSLQCGQQQYLSYDWRVSETPAGGSLELLRPGRVNPSLTVDQPGRYGLDLQVVDSTGLSGQIFHALFDVAAVPPPVVQSVDPNFFCPRAQQLTIQGANFFTVAGAYPTLQLGDELLPVQEVRNCVVYDAALQIQRCTTLLTTAPADLPAGVYDLIVVNPFPVGCMNLDGPPVVVAGAPAIDQVAPDPICRGQFDGRLTLIGSGFFRNLLQLPTVRINGVEIMNRTLEGCEPLPGNLQVCSTMQLTVPQALRDQDLRISLTNPWPADCQTAQFTLFQHEPPDIQDVQPSKICHLGGSLTLTGRHFEPGMSVRLGGDYADTVTPNAAGTVALATWNHELQPGLYDLTAVNPSGCAETFRRFQIRVTEGPFVFYVDPPVVYNGISLRATIYLGNLYGGSVKRVVLTSPAGQQIEVQFTFDPLHPNRVQALLPRGLAPGMYDVTMYDDVSCPGTTEDLLKVTDQLTLAVESVLPPFGWTRAAAAVTLRSPLPPPAGKVNFIATPRAYVNPSNPGPADQAAELRGVTFLSGQEVQGIVDGGLPPGMYDFMVVNPSGEVGLLREGFRVTQNPPPQIDAVSPGSWETGNNALHVQVRGRFFDARAASVECKTPGGALVAPPVTLGVATAELVNLFVDTGTLTHQSACALRIYNTDSSYADYSPVSVTNPAGKFVEFQPGPGLRTARRAPAVFSGTPSRTARYLYVVGGDDGNPAQALASGEFSALDRFGTPAPWQPLPYDLPAPRTLVKAVRVNDFVYLLGGYGTGGPGPGPGGGGATTEVLRARVLDPLEVARITSVDFTFLPEPGGPATGVYYYRVAAVFPNNHPSNPGGESLASDPQPVFIPRLPFGVNVVLEWSAVPGATGYRIYRSTRPDLSYGNEALLAQTPALPRTFTDDGSRVPAGATPLPMGALGRWHPFAQLIGARYNHGTASAPDPASPTVHHLYAVGGEAGGAVLDSYEVLSVLVTGPGDQTLAAAARRNAFLAQPRTELESLEVNATSASTIINGKSYLYSLSGYTSNRQASADVDAAEVRAGGLLGPRFPETKLNPFFAGYAAAAANNALVVAGGQQGVPSSNAKVAPICAACADPPTLDNWSSLSNVNLSARYLMGRATFGGFLYLVGGTGAGNLTLPTTEYSVLGGTP